jgi:hypothetical protein
MGHPWGDLRFQTWFQGRLQNRPDFAAQRWFENRLEVGLDLWSQANTDFGFQRSAHDRAEPESEDRPQEPAQVAVQLSVQNAGQKKVEAAPELAPRLRHPDLNPVSGWKPVAGSGPLRMFLASGRRLGRMRCRTCRLGCRSRRPPALTRGQSTLQIADCRLQIAGPRGRRRRARSALRA